MSHVRLASFAAFGLAVALSGSPVTAQEEAAKPEELFKQLDKNGDGKLTADEISEEQVKFFERLVRIGDSDKDGRLSREEFTAALKPDDRPVAAPAGGLGGDQGRRFDPGQMFDMLDRNKDGKLTRDELPEQARERLAPLFERLGKDELTREDFAKMQGEGGGGRPNPEEFIKRFDKNNDGQIARDELPPELQERMKPLFERAGKETLSKEDLERAFAAFGNNRPAQPGQPGQPGRPQPGDQGGRGPEIFRKLDTNGDGRLSREELAKAPDLFDQLDLNKDGSLDPRELFGPPPDGNRPERPQQPGNRPEQAGNRPAPEGNRPRPDGNRRTDGPPSVEQLLQQADANKDGKLSQDEAPPRLKERFSQVDKNSDGFLSADELREAFSRFNANRPQDGRRPQRKPE